MRLIAFKVSEDQYQDLVRTAHQRSERSLSNHIRHILEDRLAMRRQYYKTSRRLPYERELTRRDGGSLSKTKGPSRSRRPSVKPTAGPK